MRSIRDETSPELLGVLGDAAEEIAKDVEKLAATWQIRSEFDRGYVAALENTADLLRGRARRAAERIGELRGRATP